MAGYKSIKDPGKVNRMGGTQQRIFVCPYSDIDVLQPPAADSYNITTPHTCKVGKGFIELYVTKDTGELKYDPLGGPDRNSFLAKGSFYHPGESDDIEAFANQAKNDRFIVIVPLPGTKDWAQVGYDEFQVQIMPSYDATKNSAEGRGWKFDYECYHADKLKYKAASIPMAPTV